MMGQTDGQTDRPRTDARQLRRPCFAYYASRVNKLLRQTGNRSPHRCCSLSYQPAIAMVRRSESREVNISVNILCHLHCSYKLVEVSAMICALFCYKIKPEIPLYYSINSRIFSRSHRISSLWRTFALADYNRLLSSFDAWQVLPCRSI